MNFGFLAHLVAFAEEETAAEEVANTSSSAINWQSLWDTVSSWVLSTGIKLIIAIVLLIVLFKVINVVTKKIYKSLQKKNVDETIARVSWQASRIALKVIVLACLVGYVGIETASISALIASLGVGISLAVQGTLSNFAGGVIIIVMRPFKIGDFITSGDHSGTVEDIKLFYTHIITTDNKEVLIPNGTLSNNVIVNASAKDTRRVDLVASVAYGTDIDFAKSVIAKVCEKNDLIFKDPAPFIALTEMGSSSLNIVVRVWCNRPDYWTVNFYLLDQIKKAFDENGIEIPFNQLDVNLKTSEKNAPAALPKPEEK
jgi:small conductance mechanosensitive channel